MPECSRQAQVRLQTVPVLQHACHSQCANFSHCRKQPGGDMVKPAEYSGSRFRVSTKLVYYGEHLSEPKVPQTLEPCVDSFNTNGFLTTGKNEYRYS